MYFDILEIILHIHNFYWDNRITAKISMSKE